MFDQKSINFSSFIFFPIETLDPELDPDPHLEKMLDSDPP
jgi:hypothetical protein